MIIRRATNADSAGIRRLVFAVLHSYGLKPDPCSTDRDLDDLEASYLKNKGWFAVLEHDRQVVGCYGLFHIDGTTCELRKMYLSPGYRGKGHGRMLLEDALAKAQNLDYSAICLETASVLKEAIALYTKYGFEPYVPQHLSPRCDQAYRKVIKEASSAAPISQARPVIRESDYRSDLPQVTALFQEYAESIKIDLAFQGFAQELASLPGYYGPPHGRIFTADMNGLLVGVIALRKLEGFDGEVKRLFVKPEYRGMGIASTLVEKVVQEADQIGYTDLYLDTLLSMDAAISIYRRLGFREVAPYYKNPLSNVVYFKRQNVKSEKHPKGQLLKSSGFATTGSS